MQNNKIEKVHTTKYMFKLAKSTIPAIRFICEIKGSLSLHMIRKK